MARDTFQLRARVFIKGNIEVRTGLHIGGSDNAFSIGGVDNPVIKDPLTGQPYIPGSSLRGKMRSWVEKALGQVEGQRIGQVTIHSCRQNLEAYPNCPICNVFGITAEDVTGPTRLVVRDVTLTEGSVKALRRAKTDLPFTEIKTEVAIDRITSQANPRPLERVPAGAVFGPMELVYNIYAPQDIDWLEYVFLAMQLVEDDYLGGAGSRGSGKIAFTDLDVEVRRITADPADYQAVIPLVPEGQERYATLGELAAMMPEVIAFLNKNVQFGSDETP